MKTTLRLILAAVVLTTGNTPAADIASTLSVSRSDQGLHLSWPGTVRQADGTVLGPYFELQGSLDLQHWQPIGARQRAGADPASPLSATLDVEQPQAFYRLLSVPAGTGSKLGLGGEEVLGYGEAFARTT